MKKLPPKPPRNPYPRGYSPFVALPMCDAYPLAKWSALPVLNDYFALVPRYLPFGRNDFDDDTRKKRLECAQKFCDWMRRNDLRQILACAVAEAKELHQEKAAKKLAKLDPETMGLPRVVRVRYSRIIRTRLYTRDSDTPDRFTERREPATRLVLIGDIVSDGMRYAVTHSEETITTRFVNNGGKTDKDWDDDDE